MHLKALLAFSVVILMAGGAISIADSSVSSGISNNVTLGNFSLSLASNGTMENLSYLSDGLNYTFANDMSVQGSNLSSYYPTGSVSESLRYSTPNATLLTNSDSNLLLVVSKENGNGNLAMKVRFNGTVSKKSSSNTGLHIDSMDGISFDSSIWTVFRIVNTNFSGYFITDGSAVASGSNISVAPIKYLPELGGISGNLIVSGFVTNMELKNLVHRLETRNKNSFTYNSSTGLVTGKFLSFNFNNSSGLITNFTANQLNHTEVFTSISARGNGTIGSQKYLPSFSVGNFSLMGSLFVYTNSSYAYALHNNPTLNTGALLQNGTMKFTLSHDLSVTVIHLKAGVQSSLNASMVSSSPGVVMNSTFDLSSSIDATSTAYLIHGNGFRAFLYLNGYNNTSYNATSNTISVSSSNSSVAQIHFVAPPGLQNLPNLSERPLEYALMHSRLAAELNIEDLGTGAYNLTTYFNSSVHLDLTQAKKGSISFVVSSNQHYGNSVAIFVNSSFFSSSGKIYVYFDGISAKLSGSLNQTLNSTSTTNAYYSVITVTGGYLLIVHAPHFSSHNVTISSVPLNSGVQPLGLTDIDLGAIAGLIVVVAAVAFFAARRRK